MDIALTNYLGDKKEKHTHRSRKKSLRTVKYFPQQFVKEFRNFSLEKNLGETLLSRFLQKVKMLM